MKVIDIFAGAGGLSEGFRQEGFDIVAHVEMDNHACDTLKTREAYYYLKENNQMSIYEEYLLGEITQEEFYEQIPPHILNKVIEAEISSKTIPAIFKEIDRQLNGESVQFIIGGPPCQAYSTAGIARDPDRMKNDPRNYFYRYYLRFLRRYQPKAFVFENVRGILTAQEGKVFKNIRRNMNNAGYKIDYRILNAKDFGVSQDRERVIIIGWKKEIDFSYPEFEKEETALNIGQLFSDLPKLTAGESINGMGKYLTNSHDSLIEVRKPDWDILTYHIARPHNQNDLEIYRHVVDAWNNESRLLKYNELPKRVQTHNNTKTFLDRYKLVKSEDVSHTIVAHISKDGHYYIHPDIEQNRSLTVREAARIQSFPDDFYFERSRTAAFTQIGNAVPPLMAKKIAEKITEVIK